MFGFPGTWKIYLAVEPVDMRKQYDGLNSDIGVRLSGVSVRGHRLHRQIDPLRRAKRQHWRSRSTNFASCSTSAPRTTNPLGNATSIALGARTGPLAGPTLTSANVGGRGFRARSVLIQCVNVKYLIPSRSSAKTRCVSPLRSYSSTTAAR